MKIRKKTVTLNSAHDPKKISLLDLSKKKFKFRTSNLLFVYCSKHVKRLIYFVEESGEKCALTGDKK